MRGKTEPLIAIRIMFSLRYLAWFEGHYASNRAVKVVLKVEYAMISILSDSVLNLAAELDEVLSAPQQKTEWHARVQISHMNRPGPLLAVVEMLLLGEVWAREVDLRVDVVGVKEDQTVRFIVLCFLGFTAKLVCRLEIIINLFILHSRRFL